MLRLLLLVLAAAGIVAGALLCRVDRVAPGAYLVGWGVVLLCGLLFERWRYRSSPRVDGDVGRWEKTDERFVNPETGRVVQVYFDAQSGQRRYEDSADPVSGAPP